MMATGLVETQGDGFLDRPTRAAIGLPSAAGEPIFGSSVMECARGLRDSCRPVRPLSRWSSAQPPSRKIADGDWLVVQARRPMSPEGRQVPADPTPATLDLLGFPSRIRQYEDDDLEAVFQIFDQPQCRQFLGREPFATSVEVKAWFDVLPPRTIKLAATSVDVPMGIGILIPETGARAHVGGICLFVHDRFHKKGLGGALLSALIASAERFYLLRRLELIVVCDNLNALKLYQKFGFRLEGRHLGALCYGGQFHDTYTMSRLAPGAISA
jgi:L-phenylalanine/L-methionine N-acetyltransferase